MYPMKSRAKARDIRELMTVLSRVSSPKKTEAILRDLLSPKEFDDIVVRLQIIKQLKRGIPQRQIAKNLGTGIATVTRGSRELLDKSGGFHTVFREYETNKRKK